MNREQGEIFTSNLLGIFQKQTRCQQRLDCGASFLPKAVLRFPEWLPVPFLEVLFSFEKTQQAGTVFGMSPFQQRSDVLVVFELKLPCLKTEDSL